MLLLHGDKAPDTASNDGNVGRSISLMHLGVPCHCHSARSLVRFSGQRPPWLIKDERKGFGPTWSIDPPRRCARWWCRPSQILMRVSPPEQIAMMANQPDACRLILLISNHGSCPMMRRRAAPPSCSPAAIPCLPTTLSAGRWLPTNKANPFRSLLGGERTN